MHGYKNIPLLLWITLFLCASSADYICEENIWHSWGKYYSTPLQDVPTAFAPRSSSKICRCILYFNVTVHDHPTSLLSPLPTTLLFLSPSFLSLPFYFSTQFHPSIFLKVPYVDVNLDHYPERRYEMQEKTGCRTVPQIFFNSKHIGGFQELKKLVSHLSFCNYILVLR